MESAIDEADIHALETLLKACASRMDARALLAHAQGIAAAPPQRDEDLWLAEAGAGLDPACRTFLRGMVARTRARHAAPPRLGPAERLASLRAELRRRRLAGFVVPRADEHQGEYVPARAERLAWLTGFTGSAGMAVVLADTAALFVDGRYTLQARAEVDGGLYQVRHLLDEPPERWIGERLRPRGRLGYDPWLLTPARVERLRAAAEDAGGRLAACPDNPLDAIWTDQPPAPLAPVVVHPERFAGRAAADKRREAAGGLATARVDVVALSAPESIAWLLNIRGGDVPFAPLPLAFALLAADGGLELFIDPRKLTAEVRAALGPRTRTAAPADLGPALDALGAAGLRVGVDRDGAPAWIAERLAAAGARVVWVADPCAPPRGRKNAVELDGMRAAHRRDGAALCRFLAWLDAVAGGRPPRESEAVARLEAERARDPLYRGPSFPTIAGAGPNGAIVHYRLGPESDRPLEKGTLFLLDSGGQYPDGTTDVTRTVAIGEPSDEMADRFTLVLKGHIALATARFPAGTTGAQLDALARRPLWAAGLDYDHGTGHGVGCFLSVHEGPARISKLPNRIALEPGMVLSDEPGWYKPGAYGIRIENLLAVRAEAPGEGDRPFLGFEVLTLAPIDRALIRAERLDDGELAWIEAYHARVRHELAPFLDGPARDWLERATRPLGGRSRNG